MSHIYGLGFEGDGSKKYSQKELQLIKEKHEWNIMNDMAIDLGFEDGIDYCPIWIKELCRIFYESGWIKS